VKPTPSGVPVKITVPGSKVVDCDKKAMMDGTSKIMSEVFDDCTVFPLSTQERASLLGSGINCLPTITGPRGQKVSNPLAKHHCVPPRTFPCHFLAETSFATAYPATKSKAFSFVAFLHGFPIITANSTS